MVAELAASRGVETDAAIELIEAALSQEPFPPRRSVAEFAAGMRAIRVRRNDVLGKPVFRDPAWDMLLDLLVATDEQRQMSVSSLCYGAGVPVTTALRHLERLETLGLLVRRADPGDKRRYWVEPDPDALERVRDIVARMQAAA